MLKEKIATATAICLIAALFGPCVAAQEQEARSIVFTFHGAGSDKVYLTSYYGHDQHLIDSTFTGADGKGTFTLPPSYNPGMYRLDLGTGPGIDFLYNREDIILEAGKGLELESVVVAESKENGILFDYMKKKSGYGKRLSLLEPIVIYYPSDDTFHSIAEREFLKLDKEWQEILSGLVEKYKGTVAEVVIRWDQLPDIRIEELNPGVTAFYREHFFDNVFPDDTVIIRTPILPVKVIDFLSLYVKPGASMKDQEASFIEGVDAIMKWTGARKSMQETVINYLIEGFQAYGFEEVLTHIVEKYVVNQSCVSDQEESKLKQRIEGFKKMAVGNQAPDFELPDPSGETFRLSDVEKEYRLIIFWASWCPHCNSMIEELLETYREYSSEVEFIGVSIDEDPLEWENAITSKKLPWINLSDMKGWDGEVVNDYFIYATPTLFLVDNDLKIIAKPAGIGELEDTLRGL